MRRDIAVSVTLWILAAGCAGDSSPGPDGGSRPETVVAEPVGVIGVMDGPPEDLLGSVVAVALGPEGVVYVADGFGQTVRSYEPSGLYLGTVGSEGEGPGEFSYLRDLGIGPNGDLYVRDAFRLTVFARADGSPYADSLVRTTSLRGTRSQPGLRGKTDGTRYLSPSYAWEDFLIRGYYYLVFDSSGLSADTIFVPPFPNPELMSRATYRISDAGGRSVDGVNRAPFEPAPSWDVTSAGEIVMSMGGRYEIVKVGASGDTLLSIHVPVPPRAVPTRAAQDSAVAFRSRLDSIPVPMDQVRGMSETARAGRLPDVLPAVLGLQVDGPGNIWVRRWPEGDASHTLFDLFDPSGTQLETVRIPADLLADPPPWVSRDFVVGVVRDRATDLQQVVVFRVPSG